MKSLSFASASNNLGVATIPPAADPTSAKNIAILMRKAPVFPKSRKETVVSGVFSAASVCHGMNPKIAIGTSVTSSATMPLVMSILFGMVT